MARRFQLFLASSTRVELCLPTLGALSSWSFLLFIFANKFKISPRRDSNSRTNTSRIRGLPLVHRGDRLAVLFFIYLFFHDHFYFPAQLVPGRRFYPQRSSGQAVVTGVVPFSPWYLPESARAWVSNIRWKLTSSGNAEPYARYKLKASTRGEKGRHLWPRLVQKIAEGKTSYELSWKVEVMINI